ncbi:hypothetical protein L3X38_011314 [Prunus dulcis]|uniref:Uncharacterized protein n=1 Tax=Prunus dulcis TaxID=3755 RepID=A0AAD4WHZ7_PRUDU|nr:hypothetical protein L3X38_011314 [Prunus dulcis]
MILSSLGLATFSPAHKDLFLGAHWLRVRRNSEVKRVGQILAGCQAQNGQYRATAEPVRGVTEREHFLSQLSQLIPNFDPSMLKPRISQSPKNPMSDKASCSGGDVRSLHFEDDTAKMGKHQEDEEKEEEKKDEEKEEEKEKEDEEKHDDKVIEVGDYSNMEAPSSLKTLCRYVETTLVPEEKILQFTIDKEVFGRERDTFLLPENITQFAGMEEIGATVLAVYMRYLHGVLKQANMCSMVGFIDPATVSANSGTIADRSRLVAARLQKTDGEQIFMMPYNPGLVSLTGFCFYDFQ